MRIIFIAMLTPFVPEENRWVKKKSDYIKESWQGAVMMIGMLFTCRLILLYVCKEACKVIEALLMIYIAGVIISGIYHIVSWKDSKKSATKRVHTKGTFTVGHVKVKYKILKNKDNQ